MDTGEISSALDINLIDKLRSGESISPSELSSLAHRHGLLKDGHMKTMKALKEKFCIPQAVVKRPKTERTPEAEAVFGFHKAREYEEKADAVRFSDRRSATVLREANEMESSPGTSEVKRYPSGAATSSSTLEHYQQVATKARARRRLDGQHSGELRPGVVQGCVNCKYRGCVACRRIPATWQPNEGKHQYVAAAPTFMPSAEEFRDPIKYIASIREEAEKYGICKIVPPPEWPRCPPSQLTDPEKFSDFWSKKTFPTRMQQTSMLQNRESCLDTPLNSKGRCEEDSESNEFGFGPGKDFTLNEFKVYAHDFHHRYFRVGNSGEGPSVKEIEAEFWRIVEAPTHDIQVAYGADIETSAFATGFPSKGSKGGSSAEVDLWGWNLQNIARVPGSLLAFEDTEITGVVVPWVYIGMCLSAFCWHVEDHHFYSLNYMHSGATKVWYGVPGWAAEKMEVAMKKRFPHLFEADPNLLQRLVTQCSPSILREEQVPVYRLEQNEGHFVITFPRAYHAGFNTGFNIAEAVNAAPVDWLPHGQIAVDFYQRQARRTSVSHDKLLVTGACSVQKLLSSEALGGGPIARMWREQCGVGKVFAVALEKRVTAIKAQRKQVCENHMVLVQTMDPSFDAMEERECLICHYDLHVSAISSPCRLNVFACLDHLSSLCTCSEKHPLLLLCRYSDQDLDIIVNLMKYPPRDTIRHSSLQETKSPTSSQPLHTLPKSNAAVGPFLPIPPPQSQPGTGRAPDTQKRQGPSTPPAPSRKSFKVSTASPISSNPPVPGTSLLPPSEQAAPARVTVHGSSMAQPSPPAATVLTAPIPRGSAPQEGTSGSHLHSTPASAHPVLAQESLQSAAGISPSRGSGSSVSPVVSDAGQSQAARAEPIAIPGISSARGSGPAPAAVSAVEIALRQSEAARAGSGAAATCSSGSEMLAGGASSPCCDTKIQRQHLPARDGGCIPGGPEDEEQRRGAAGGAGGNSAERRGKKKGYVPLELIIELSDSENEGDGRQAPNDAMATLRRKDGAQPVGLPTCTVNMAMCPSSDPLEGERQGDSPDQAKRSCPEQGEISAGEKGTGGQMPSGLGRGAGFPVGPDTVHLRGQEMKAGDGGRLGEERVLASPPRTGCLLGTGAGVSGPRVARVMRRNEGLAMVKVLRLGELIVREGWCNRSSIFPRGYCCETEFTSMLSPLKKALYRCTVLEGMDGSPVFEVFATEMPMKEFRDSSPDGVWGTVQKVLDQTHSNLPRTANFGRELPSLREDTGALGMDLFGFHNPHILQRIETLDPDRQSYEYWRVRPPLSASQQLPLPPQPSRMPQAPTTASIPPAHHAGQTPLAARRSPLPAFSAASSEQQGEGIQAAGKNPAQRTLPARRSLDDMLSSPQNLEIHTAHLKLLSETANDEQLVALFSAFREKGSGGGPMYTAAYSALEEQLLARRKRSRPPGAAP